MSSKGCKKSIAKNQKLFKSSKELGLTQKQFDEINKTFCMIDQDNNGKISRPELGYLIKALGRSMSDRDIDAMMVDADSDGSGQVEFHQLLPLIAKEYGASAKKDKETRDTFRTFDQNGDGVITAREFRCAVAKMGLNLSDAEVAAFMSSCDKDGDGVITYDEFAKYVVTNL